MIQPLWRAVWRFLKKLKIELPYDPAIPLLGIYPEKTIIQRVMYQNVHCSSIYKRILKKKKKTQNFFCFFSWPRTTSD